MFNTAERKFNTAEHKFNTAEHKFNTAEHRFNTAEHRFLLGVFTFFLMAYQELSCFSCFFRQVRTAFILMSNKQKGCD